MSIKKSLNPNASTNKQAKQSFKLQDYERAGVSSDEVQQIKDAFDLFDPQHTGFVSPKQLKASLQSLGGEALNQAIYHMISDLVLDDAPYLNFSDFLDLMTARVSTKDTREDMRKIFNLFDEEKSGFISINSLKRVIKELGESIDESELYQMIQKADTDGDKLINQEDFYNVMTRKIAKGGQ